MEHAETLEKITRAKLEEMITTLLEYTEMRTADAYMIDDHPQITADDKIILGFSWMSRRYYEMIKARPDVEIPIKMWTIGAYHHGRTRTTTFLLRYVGLLYKDYRFHPGKLYKENSDDMGIFHSGTKSITGDLREGKEQLMRRLVDQFTMIYDRASTQDLNAVYAVYDWCSYHLDQLRKESRYVKSE